MNTVLIILALLALLTVVLGRLQANHRRSRSGPLTGPLGADVRLDHDADRLGAELTALAAHRVDEQSAAPTPAARGRRPVHGVPRAA